jgi:hypothetical protein
MDIGLADGHWTMGKSHLLALGAVIDTARAEAEKAGEIDPEHTVFSGPYSASIHLLAGYALELLLKSACYLHGGEGGVRKLGHDLTAVLDEAEKLGFVSSAEQLRAVVGYLRAPHLNHQFRYGGADEVAMPDLDATLEVLYCVCHELQDPLEAAMKEAGSEAKSC